jgi:signal transduction histidine kinase/DNA-binding response OmpR family regulator/ligand-binding sensor domain-containing protein
LNKKTKLLAFFPILELSSVTTNYLFGILLHFLFFSSPCFSQIENHFENPIVFDENNGIEVGTISDIVVDKNGFLWISGNHGLQRFDGYRFKTFINDPMDSLSLLCNNIYDLLYEEEKNQLWISTWGFESGVSVLNLETEKFKNYPKENSLPSGVNGNGIYWTYKDKFDNFWFSGAGLSKYIPESDSFEHYPYQPLTSETDLNSALMNRFEWCSPDVYNDSLLWIGSGNGLLKFNVVTHKYTRYFPDSNEENKFEVRTVFHHQDDKVYFGTWETNGLFSFDTKTHQFNRCNFEGYSKNSGIPINSIYTIKAKSKDLLWITTRAGLVEYDISQNKLEEVLMNDPSKNKYYGAYHLDSKGRTFHWKKDRLSIYDPMLQQVKPYKHQPKGEEFNFIVRRILEDDETGKLWIASQMSEGLYRLDLETGEWEIFPPPNDYFKLRTTFLCWDVLKTQSGELLILEQNKIYRFSKEEQKLVPWEFQPNVKGAIFKRMIEDAQGNIWVGSNFDGVFKINPNEKTIRHFEDEFINLNHNKVGSSWDLQEDRNGNIWIRGNGVSVYDISRDSVFNFPYFFPEKEVVYHIEALGIDGAGNVWVASHEGAIGITNADFPEKGIVEYFDESNGLRTNQPSRFLLDQHKNVWIASNTLEKVSPDRSESTLFKSSYLPDAFFESISQLSNGNIVVGFRKGVGVFDPDQLTVNELLIHPYVQSFKVFDKNVKIESSNFQKGEVLLKPNQNFFSLEISAINPAYFGDLEFLYQLEGVDPDWVASGERSYVAYTDVKSGNYLFKLKAKNNEGIWNETPYELRINIATPWYRTWWTYFLVAFLIMSILYFIYRNQLSRKLSEQETHRLKELDGFKTKFYSNITHEFRTPLTIIQGMADELEKNPQVESKQKLNLIKKNGQRLLNLVNQMLDLSKLKAGKLTVDSKQDDIIRFLRYSVETHDSLAKLKNVGLQFFSEEEELLMDFDAGKLEQVLSNLISNAIKFTPEYGKILVFAKPIKSIDSATLEIKVMDNGIGISPKQLPYIFDRFHQANSSNENQGTGIGLALVKELIGIMNGNIRVESQLKIGTTFFLTLPILNNAPISTSQEYLMEKSKVAPAVISESEISLTENGLPLLLIIEDNIDVTYYLKKCLENEYQILNASNGKIGIDIALEKIPDIIISDVMMPEMDGFEVCAILKEDERTNHIPIILLTAKATSEDKLAGLTQGADAYLTKPFEKTELLIRTKKLLETRRTLQKKYSASLIELSNVEEASEVKEDSFIEKTHKIVVEHLGEEDFSVNDLARELHLSRSQVHRKIKALTGLSTAIYIRLIRLQKAKELLASDTLTISEIAYEVGFKSPVYFSQVFKETFGESPSATRK